MLDAIAAISSVSGGSFTSACFGLYGDRIFIDFEERFLRRPPRPMVAALRLTF